jgi:hypothetical protein
VGAVAPPLEPVPGGGPRSLYAAASGLARMPALRVEGRLRSREDAVATEMAIAS